MTEALKTLHLHDFVHRDVKMENILINTRGEVKISDFGVAKQLLADEGSCETFVGTRALMAPERFGVGGGTGSYSKPSDVWSLGVCVYEMATGKLPKQGRCDAEMRSPPKLFDQIREDPVPVEKDGFENICGENKHVILPPAWRERGTRRQSARSRDLSGGVRSASRECAGQVWMRTLFAVRRGRVGGVDTTFAVGVHLCKVTSPQSESAA